MWKSKTLAVDYLMVDERAKEQPEIMDYVRDILFGNVNGQTLHSYWAKNNTPYCVFLAVLQVFGCIGLLFHLHRT